MSLASPPFQPNVYQTALTALRTGISCIPILVNGSKAPAIRWKEYQHTKPTLLDVRRWFMNSEYGIAFITGQVSGGLEMLDFDNREIYGLWVERIRLEGLEMLLERIERGYKEESPRGVHLFYRYSSIEGNQKLARKPTSGPEKFKVLIETRGEGGYSIVAPSYGGVHPSGQSYRLVRGSVSRIATISLDERALLFTIARVFDEVPLAVPQLPHGQTARKRESENGARRPGDVFNERMTWEELLPRYGWELVRYVGEEGLWRRPGKEHDGVSATTNYGGSDLLYVFSTATVFETERGYSKFSAYALLEHTGDFSVAAKALAEQGCVDEREMNVV